MSNDDLRNNIALLEDGELLIRYSSGTLVDEAKPIFLEEMERRGIDSSRSAVSQAVQNRSDDIESFNRARHKRNITNSKRMLWRLLRAIVALTAGAIVGLMNFF